MRSTNLLSKGAICVASFLLFLFSFRLNELFDNMALYSTGISLVFIPAGFKLLCLLVGGEAAAAGLLLSSVYLSMRIWDHTTVLQMVYFAFASVGSYYVAVVLVKKFLHINHRLDNLHYLHIVVLSAAASLLNGITLNIIFLWQDKKPPGEFFVGAAAMVLGDFLGCFIVIMFFNLCITLACKLVDNKQATNNRYANNAAAPNENTAPVRHDDR